MEHNELGELVVHNGGESKRVCSVFLSLCVLLVILTLCFCGSVHLYRPVSALSMQCGCEAPIVFPR